MRKLFVLVIVFISGASAFAQESMLVQYAKTHRGNSLYTRFGIHDGNRVAITFRNNGSISGTNPNDIRGAWPYPMTQDSYIGDVTPLVGVQLPVRDYNGDGKLDTLHSVTIAPGPRNGQAAKIDPADGHFQGFAPEPGYFNPAQDTLAMSNIPTSWPAFWPDHPDWVDSTGHAEWNGYFGKGQFSADQESFFVMDDAQDNSVQQRTNNLFHPDSTDTTRNGIGIVVSVRGLQWSQIQAQDVLFWLYDITNISTTIYKKTVFGEVVGGCVGDVGQNYVDCQDDLAFFDLNNNLTYTWDSDDKTADRLWIPLNQVLPGVRNNIGYAGYAYLESPGNGFDGIDNNNSSVDPNSPIFQQSDFSFSLSVKGFVLTRTLSRTNPGSSNFPANEIVLIDPTTYQRQVVRLDTLLKSSTDTVTVYSLGMPYKIYDGETLSEIPNNGLDDNLNGLIDEDYDLHYQRVFKDAYGNVYKKDLRPLAYRNYFTGAGLDNTMIDERRDSGPGTIVTGWVPDYTQPRDPVTGKYPGVVKTHWSGDENGNWNPKYDDVGADGVPDTHDYGEGDGIPTEGEPHFDKTDVNESDQIGLTSFNFFNQTQSPPMNNSETLWNRMVPGYFDVIPRQPMDGDFIYASGYFPLLPNHTERFSLALVFGADSSMIFRNKQIVQRIYDKNYDFVKPPPKPHVVVIPGDKKVTLIWDKTAETAPSFEGYKIYRSTDPGFTEAGGQALATFDRVDGIQGYFLPTSQDLAQLPMFYLGGDVGLVHTYVDSGLQNGQGYFYAVTAYTTGDPQADTYPAEDPKFVNVQANGQVRTDVNTAYVVPQAPQAGYVGPDAPSYFSSVPGTKLYGTGSAYLKVVNPNSVPNKTYRVGFADTLNEAVPTTTTYYIIDYSNPSSPDTMESVPFNSTQSVGDRDKYIFDGMYVTVNNDWSIKVDTSKTGWNTVHAKPNFPFTFSPFQFAGVTQKGFVYPEDYDFVFDSVSTASDTSTALTITYSGSPLAIAKENTNFRVYDPYTGKLVPYALLEPDCISYNQGCGRFSTDDIIILLAHAKGQNGADTTLITWSLSPAGSDTVNHLPTTGDTLRIRVSKPFINGDQLEITTKSAAINDTLASNQLGMIRVVPNPYVAATSQEPPLPPTITSGRGDRKISFIHLPKNSVIYIYTVRGELVQKLEMPSGQSMNDGTINWDLRTKDNLEVAYGVYFYLVDAPGVGQKYGKLAIIK